MSSEWVKLNERKFGMLLTFFYKSQYILPRFIVLNFLTASASICSYFVSGGQKDIQGQGIQKQC